MLNRYAYVKNNPLKYTDPDGHVVVTGSLIMGLSALELAYGVTIGASIGIIAGGWINDVFFNQKESSSTDSTTKEVKENKTDEKVSSPALDGDPYSPDNVDDRRKEWENLYGDQVPQDHEGDYHPAPKELKAFPDAIRAKPKTPVQGGGGLRKRWKDKKGNIYEWYIQHGNVEKYNKHGKHKGEFDPKTGKKT